MARRKWLSPPAPNRTKFRGWVEKVYSAVAIQATEISISGYRSLRPRQIGKWNAIKKAKHSENVKAKKIA
jgi:hypothetical protein